MDGSAFDLLVAWWTDWIFDKIEDRYGRAFAWLVTFGTVVILIGIAVWAVVAVSR